MIASSATAPRWRRITVAILRFVMGLPLLLFGINLVFPFIPEPPPESLPADAQAFVAALKASGYMLPLIGVTQLFTGLCLVTNRFVPLGLTVFAPFLVNSVLFHLVLEPSGLGMALVFAAIELFLVWSYRAAYRDLLVARCPTG